MNKGLLIRLLLCIFVFGIFLYTYIDKQNDLTELKMEIPKLIESLHVLNEENSHLRFEIERLENPTYLMQLLREKEFSHLHYPYANEVIMIQ